MASVPGGMRPSPRAKTSASSSTLSGRSAASRAASRMSVSGGRLELASLIASVVFCLASIVLLRVVLRGGGLLIRLVAQATGLHVQWRKRARLCQRGEAGACQLEYRQKIHHDALAPLAAVDER